ERALARAEQLLERYGLVSRELALAEDCPGGFGALYPVLEGLEEAGRVRRGYFVEGLSGAQFALPGALERLRAARPEREDRDALATDVVLLAALDPANPWGAVWPWPASGDETARPRRVAGAWVITVAGRPMLYLGPGGRRLQTFPVNGGDDRSFAAAFEALHRLPRRRTLVIERIDGQPARESVHYATMRECGFIDDYRGLAAEIGQRRAS
ncbi:DEAD/DEAH box helicase, partial [Thioalkalicoccus limnaeus]